MKGKRYCFWLFIIATAILLFITACTKPDEQPTCTVKLNMNYLGLESVLTVPRGSTIEPPVVFDRTGYDLSEWRVTAGGEERAWNFESDVVTKDITLSAVWVPKQHQLYLHPGNGEQDIVLSLEYGKPYELPSR